LIRDILRRRGHACCQKHPSHYFSERLHSSSPSVLYLRRV
jgi:hypothetical protein